ncbi:hypothetical protein BN1221_03843 [Brenneria goodwinii]|uniref:Uncharacterized protein n=1 Tax=Brenneria goodwinii TaxID=1109412 RepID=A0A0G4JZQ9_9GAMM|nr:hypothetical protein BN1221_03843 [Brenneria goodwinii]
MGGVRQGIPDNYHKKTFFHYTKNEKYLLWVNMLTDLNIHFLHFSRLPKSLALLA